MLSILSISPDFEPHIDPPNSSSATKRGDRIAVLEPPLSPYPVLIQRRFELKKGYP